MAWSLCSAGDQPPEKIRISKRLRWQQLLLEALLGWLKLSGLCFLVLLLGCSVQALESKSFLSIPEPWAVLFMAALVWSSLLLKSQAVLKRISALLFLGLALYTNSIVAAICAFLYLLVRLAAFLCAPLHFYPSASQPVHPHMTAAPPAESRATRDVDFGPYMAYLQRLIRQHWRSACRRRIQTRGCAI